MSVYIFQKCRQPILCPQKTYMQEKTAPVALRVHLRVYPKLLAKYWLHILATKGA